jgi:signal transduction histidine kinase
LVLVFFPSSHSVLIATDQLDYPIGQYIRVMEDPLGDLQPSAALASYRRGNFEQLENPRLFNEGFTESIWWFGFGIENGLGTDNSLIFSPAGATIRDATLFTFDQKGDLIRTQATGFDYSGGKRDLASRINSFQLNLPKNEKFTYLLRVDSRGMNTYIPFFLDEPNSYWEYETVRASKFGTVTGLILMATLLGIFLWFYFFEKMYLIFVGYLLSSLALVLEEDGYLFLWVYGSKIGWITPWVIPFFSVMMSTFLLLFINEFFFIKSTNRRLQWGIRIYFGGIFLITAMLLISGILDFEFGSILVFQRFGFFISTVNILLVLGVNISQIRENREISLYLLLANLVLIFGFTNYILNLQGLIDWHPLRPNGLMVGSIFNVILLTIGIIHRYYFLKKDKEYVEQKLIQQERDINRNIIEAQENERQRIAKDLHDDLGGLLALIKLKLGSLRMEAENSVDDQRRAALAETDQLLDMACKDLRFIAHELMPMEANDKSLRTMVKEVLDLVKLQKQIKITYTIEELPFMGLESKINLFRIIKELLNNIIKHSQAKEADVQVFLDEIDDTVTLMVTDDGRGIPKDILASPKKGLGLKNLQKRVDYLLGHLHIDSHNNGTTVIVTVPVKQISISHEYKNSDSR